MIISVIGFSEKGYELAVRLAKEYGDHKEKLRKAESVQWRLFSKCKDMPGQETAKTVEDLTGWTGEQFAAHHVLLFIGACGIAVRAIAPFVRDKLADSPVLVMDETGKYVIPILSGHVGGANRLAKEFAEISGAQAVLTTATDVNDMLSVDSFATESGFSIQNRNGIRQISGRILSGKKVTCAVDGMDETQCRIFLGKHAERIWGKEAVDRLFAGILPVSAVKGSEGDSGAAEKDESAEKLDILVSEKSAAAQLWLRPRLYVLGMGCKKGKSTEKLSSFAEQELTRLHIAKEEVWMLASADRKREEDGLLELADAWHVPFYTFAEERLAELEGEFSGSDFVEQTIGVDNVCERAAMAGCGGKGEFVLRKTAKDGMTLAIVKRDWRQA